MRRASRLLLCFIPAVLAACGGAPDPGTVLVTQSHSQARSAAQIDVQAPGAYHDVIQRFYVAYFGRPADVSGLDFWSAQYLQAGMPAEVAGFTDAYDNDATVRMFVDAFGASQESQDLYGGDNSAFVTAVYRNLFNRDPDPAGKAYWLDKLERGILSRPVTAFQIMRGAQSSDIAIVDRKVAVATAFTRALDTDREREAYGTAGATAAARAMLATVDAATDPATFTGIATTLDALLENLGPAQQYLSYFYGINQLDRIGMVAPSGNATGIEVSPPGAKLILPGLFADPLPGPEGVAHDSETFWISNRLYRQPLTSHGNVPTAVVVSTQAKDETCDTRTFTDEAMPVKSILVFRQPGADGICSNLDDTYAAARMDMSNLTAPQPVKETLFAMRSASGAISGFLVRNGQNIERVDASFANPVTMFAAPSDDAVRRMTPLYNQRRMGNLFLFTSGGTVYAWNADRGTAATPKALAPEFSYTLTFNDALAADADTMYFTTRAEGKIILSRYAVASDSVTAVAEIPAVSREVPTSESSLHMTAAYFVIGNPVDNAVWVVPRVGGSARLLYSGAQPLDPAVKVAGERVWFRTVGGLASIQTDGSGMQVLADATYAGCVYREGARVESRNDECASMLAFSADTLRGYDAVSGALALTYGTVPPLVSPVYLVSNVSANRSRGTSGHAMLLTRSNIDARTYLTVSSSQWRFVAGQPGLTPVTGP